MASLGSCPEVDSAVASPLVEGSFRFRVAVVAARGEDEPTDPATDDGWELVRSSQTKDGVSKLLLYRRPT
ncbi:MAG: hypothetical protein ACYDD4_13475 [Acidimicrobiales bacterium]